MNRHEHHVDWRVLLFYGIVSVVVLAVGGLVLFTYLERQALLQGALPEPLPKVTVVTAVTDSSFVASWIAFLTRADFAPTLVPLERLDSLQGVLVVTNIAALPEKLNGMIEAYVQGGGGVVVLGTPPRGPAPFLDLLSTDAGMSDSQILMAESVSPLLARMNPGYTIGSKPVPVAFIDETPKMNVDARWKGNSRAAVVHYEHGKGRVMWLGFDPAAFYKANDMQLNLFLRTSIRWVAGQPISDGAIGPPEVAKTLTPEARAGAREKRFAFSVDRLRRAGTFSVRMKNRGTTAIDNPTVKLWLPSRVKDVKLAGSFYLRRGASIIGVPTDGTVLVMLPSLGPNQERMLKLRVTAAD